MVSLRVTHTIRLRRGGHKRLPVYQIICTPKYKRNKTESYIRLGFISLTNTDRFFFLDLHFLGSCLNNGALLNNTVKKYISKFVKL